MKESFRDDNVFVIEYTVHEAVVEGRRQWFLYTVASPAHVEYYNCQACSLLLGAAMFEKQDAGWVNKAHTPLLAMVGNLRVPPNEPKSVQWGRQAFGLVIEDGWTGYGEMTTFRTLFACENGRFRVRSSQAERKLLRRASFATTARCTDTSRRRSNWESSYWV